MQGLGTDQTIRQLIFSYKGSQRCMAEKQAFDLCRATPIGSAANPEHCEGQVSNFLECYREM